MSKSINIIVFLFVLTQYIFVHLLKDTLQNSFSIFLIFLCILYFLNLAISILGIKSDTYTEHLQLKHTLLKYHIVIWSIVFCFNFTLFKDLGLSDLITSIYFYAVYFSCAFGVFSGIGFKLSNDLYFKDENTSSFNIKNFKKQIYIVNFLTFASLLMPATYYALFENENILFCAIFVFIFNLIAKYIIFSGYNSTFEIFTLKNYSLFFIPFIAPLIFSIFILLFALIRFLDPLFQILIIGPKLYPLIIITDFLACKFNIYKLNYIKKEFL